MNKMNIIGGDILFFSKSEQIKELIGNHTDVVMKCFTQYEMAMQAVLDNVSLDKLEVYTNQIRSFETQADEVRHQIIRNLLEGGLLLDSRKSLMRMIEGVDEVADIAEIIIQEIYIQNIQIPEFMHKAIIEISQVTRKQLLLLIESVKKIVDKYKVNELSKVILEIEGLESEVDVIQQGITKELFTKDIPLAEKLQLKEIVSLVGSMSDKIEDISDLIEIIMMARKV